MIESPLRIGDFRLFLGGRFFAGLSLRMQEVAVGYYLYDATGNPVVLGYAALSVFLPIALFTLPGGDVADRFDRRHILGACHLANAAAAGALFFLVFTRTTQPWLFYAVLSLTGAARAFSAPAQASFLPFLVPREIFGQAVAWGTSANQIATVLGPALGGLMYLAGAWAPFAACFVASPIVAAAMLSIGTRAERAEASGTTAWHRVVEGLKFLRRQPVVLGAISLDLFAVLLGSVTALLPIFARDILNIGPDGLGVLRSSMAVGSLGMALTLAHLPAARQPHAGAAMFGGVAIFGAGVIVFGLSRSFALSVAALAVMGAADSASVFVRSSLVQLGTPDKMRGRVSSVHSLFVSAANEFGDFRAGLAAAWLGAAHAALAGGLCTLAVVAAWTRLFPQLRRIEKLAHVGADRA